MLSLYPVPVLGVGTPGIANPMRLTGKSMVLGFNPASTGQFIANAELAAVDLTLHGNLTVGNQSTGLFSLFNGAKASVGSALKLEQFGTAGRRVGFTRFGVADYAFNYSAPVNTWTHLAFVGTSGSTTLYVNGLASGTIAAGIPLPMQRLGDPTGDRLKGLVDELLIFNRALSPVEIQQVRDATGTP